MINLIHHITCSLILPNMFIASFAEGLEKRMKRATHYWDNQSEFHKYMLIKCLELYQKLIPFLSDDKIVGILSGDPLIGIFGRGIISDENVYIQILRLISSIVKLCENRKELKDVIVKSFNSTHKMHFPSSLVEKLCENLFEVTMKDKSWNDVTKFPSVKIIFTIMRNVLKLMPVELDEKYVNEFFTKLLHSSRSFLKSNKKSLMNTHLVNQIFGIIEILTSLNYTFHLKDEQYSTLFLWIKDSDKVEKALIWMIIGNLTRKKVCFDKFCEGFKDELNLSLFDLLEERVVAEDVKSHYEQKAIAYLIENFLDHTANKSEPNDRMNQKLLKLISKFFNQKPIFHDILSFLVKKMIQNKIPETAKIVKQRRIIEYVLYNKIDNLDMVTFCYSYDELKEHVADVIVNIQDKRVVELIERLHNATDLESIKTMKSEKFKQINHSVLNILSILMSSNNGIQKLSKILRIPNLFESFVMAVFGGLKITNPSSEILFHLKFLNNLLSAYTAIMKGDLSSTVFGSCEIEIKHNKQFLKIPEEIGSEFVTRTENCIFEGNFQRIKYACDLFLLQIIKILNYPDFSKQSTECKLNS